MEDAGQVEEVRKAEKGDVKKERDDKEDFKNGGELFRVDLNEASKGLDFGSIRIVPDDVVAGELHDGGFECGDGVPANGCCDGMIKGGGW